MAPAESKLQPPTTTMLGILRGIAGRTVSRLKRVTPANLAKLAITVIRRAPFDRTPWEAVRTTQSGLQNLDGAYQQENK